MGNMNLNNAADSPETKKHSRRGLVAGSILMMVWTGFGWNSLSVYAVKVVPELGIETAQFAFMFTILSMTTMLCSWFWFGTMIEKLGVRLYVTISGILFSLGFVIMGMSHSIYTLWAGCFVFGIGLSGININCFQTMVQMWFKRNTSKYTGIGQAFGPLGGAISSAILGVVLPAFGWRLPFFVVAGISLVTIVLVAGVFFREPDKIGVTPAGENYLKALKESGQEQKGVKIDDGLTFRESLRQPRTWLLLVCYIFAGICDYGLLGNFALIGAHYGYGHMAGLIMSFSWLAQLVSFIAIGAICDRWGSKIAMLICACMVVIVCVIFLQDSVPIALIFISGALLGFADGAVQLPMGASARELLGTKDFAKKMGLIGGGCYCGVMISAVTVAKIFDATGSYKPAMIFILCLSIVTAVLFFPATKKIEVKKEADQVQDSE